MVDTSTKEIGISALKSAFGAVPFAGQLINEVFFDYRSRVKQERLNTFIELLSEFFNEQTNYNLENLKTEEFGDLFESVLKRVTLTKSIEKKRRFRDIVINQIQNPLYNVDNTETYLDLVTSLNEIEIQILKSHSVFNEEFENKRTELSQNEHKLMRLEEQLKKEQNLSTSGFANNCTVIEQNLLELRPIVKSQVSEINGLQEIRKEKYYNISKNDFLYYKQTLFSKGLLIDVGIGAIGVKPFQAMGITEFGEKFIQYITNT